jgi:hypothetical protein
MSFSTATPVYNSYDFDSYEASGLTKKKPPETERRFCALRLRFFS